MSVPAVIVLYSPLGEPSSGAAEERKDALWSLQTLFRPSSVLLVPGRLRCTLRGRCRLYSVRLPFFSSLADSDVRFAVAADAIPSIFRTSRPRQNPMYAPRSLRTLFRPSSVLLVHGRIRCTLRGRCRLCSVHLPYFSSLAESDVRFAVAADSIPSAFRTSRPRHFARASRKAALLWAAQQKVLRVGTTETDTPYPGETLLSERVDAPDLGRVSAGSNAAASGCGIC